jgi:selenocysteine lyase/cysteine desulfurase
MKNSVNRRQFLRRTFSGIAATSLLSASDKTSLLASVKSLPVDGDSHFWGAIKAHFSLRPDLTYLNNASLGPSSEIVIDANEKYRRLLDGFPSKYMWEDWWDDKERVRSKAAALINASADEVTLNHNTTEGLNLVAHSLQLQPGDEVIIGDHEHHTGSYPFRHFLEARGAKIVTPVLPIMPESAGDILDVYTKAITSKTRAILVCHMVNTNGMILPIRELCEIAHKRDIVVTVDAAQTVGMIKVDVKELGCDFMATSAHKWLHGPKGTGLFYAKAERLAMLTPLIVCKQYFEDKTARRFESYNTRNLPEVLALGDAIDFHNFIGTEKKESRIRELKGYLGAGIAERPFLRLKTPADDNLSAGITVAEVVGQNITEITQHLEQVSGIIVRPMEGHGLNAMRISTAIFNTKTEINSLFSALDEIAG